MQPRSDLQCCRLEFSDWSLCRMWQTGCARMYPCVLPISSFVGDSTVVYVSADAYGRRVVVTDLGRLYRNELCSWWKLTPNFGCENSYFDSEQTFFRWSIRPRPSRLKLAVSVQMYLNMFLFSLHHYVCEAQGDSAVLCRRRPFFLICTIFRIFSISREVVASSEGCTSSQADIFWAASLWNVFSFNSHTFSFRHMFSFAIRYSQKAGRTRTASIESEYCIQIYLVVYYYNVVSISTSNDVYLSSARCNQIRSRL